MFLSLGVIEGLTDGLGIGMVAAFFTRLGQDGELALDSIRSDFSFLPEFMTASPQAFTMSIVGLYLVRILILLGSANLRCIFPQTLIYKTRTLLTSRVLGLPLKEIEGQRAGHHLNALIIDSVKASSFVFQMVECIYLSVVVGTYFAVVMLFNWKFLTISLIALLPILFLYRYGLKIITRISHQLLDIRNDIASKMNESLTQLKFIKAVGTEDYEYEQLEKGYQIYRKTEIRRFFIQYLAALMPQFVVLLGVTGVFALYFYNSGQYRAYLISAILPACLILSRSFGSVSKLNTAIISAKQNMVSALSIIKLLDESVEVDIAKISSDHKNFEFDQPIKEVSISKLSVDYDGKSIFSNFNLNMESGRPVILRGSSGSGKTTLANAIRLLVKPTSGQVRFNGVEIKPIAAWSIRKKIGYCTQLPALLYGSIRDNLTYGIFQDVSDDHIWSALDDVGAKGFVQELDKKLDSMVYERGANFSEGQKQRLALARMVLKDPDVLILDEITNGLDPVSKGKVIHAVSLLSEKKVCLVISHDEEFVLSNSKEVSLSQKI